MKNFKLHNLHLRLLRELHKNSRETYGKLSKISGVSSVTCHNWIQAMKKEGIIKRFTIDINYKKLGYNVEALIEVKAKRSLSQKIAKKISTLPNVTHVWDVTGETDIIIRAFFRNTEELSSFLYNTLQKFPEIERMTTHVVLESYENPSPLFLQ
ncbi:Lrp/AsnC family transcriptional regulator [Thermococcus sp.]|uniref:Lrp/AsnC family transcriptional regulator n=2 Tax=Thermococcus sp. TaxID=35749 RepID=UPI000BC393A0|nr:Lrp/AsnC family transcriptional regulator [Thermococcus sp.]MCD6143148.1 Lrp/AsnC family transcriptional regulator [Thermococcus sp.]OYT33618.1 MAG: AsnC family transcriptional regulator [Archaeoglobales archaeon ex4484_92]RLF82288.1 MAG: AsnC family transcriptional regulator [Thermococci archaeon]